MWGCLQYLFAFFTKLCSFIPFFYFIYVAHQRSALALRISTSLIIFCIQFVIMEEKKSLFWEIVQLHRFYFMLMRAIQGSAHVYASIIFFVFNNQSFNLNIQWTSNCMYLMAFFFFCSLFIIRNCTICYSNIILFTSSFNVSFLRIIYI